MTHPAPPFDPWLWLEAWNETWAAGLWPTTAASLREQRLAALMACALRDSPLYRRRASGAQRLADFEPVDKAELMLHFDDWATDRRITRDAAASFIADTDRIADAWLGDYLVWTSSGTSGVPGWFVQDARSLAAYDAIDALRLRSAGSLGSLQASLGNWGLGQRFAYVGATGGHFAGLVTMTRLQRVAPIGLAPDLTLLSVQQPLRSVAAALQALQPTVVITYPSCAAALAQLQRKGTLRLSLREVWVGGEQLSAEQRHQVSEAFGCKVRNNYGASECFSIAWECAHGCLHVNDDWAILEPVDERLQPVPPGEVSHTTLLTNLANHVQPLIRFDLGDRIRLDPAPCRCGCALPVVQVRGRRDDVLVVPGHDGLPVTLLPLALTTVLEDDAGVFDFQLRQVGARAWHLTLGPGEAPTPAQRARCRQVLAAFAAAQGAAPPRIVTRQADALPPGPSGKRQRVVAMPWAAGADAAATVAGAAQRRR